MFGGFCSPSNSLLLNKSTCDMLKHICLTRIFKCCKTIVFYCCGIDLCIMYLFCDVYAKRIQMKSIEKLFILISYPRYPKTKYLDESSVEDFTQKWPTFVDMTGFQNDGAEDVKQTLEFVINGCFKDGARLNTSLRNQRYNEMNISSNLIKGLSLFLHAR